MITINDNKVYNELNLMCGNDHFQENAKIYINNVLYNKNLKIKPYQHICHISRWQTSFVVYDNIGGIIVKINTDEDIEKAFDELINFLNDDTAIEKMIHELEKENGNECYIHGLK